MQEPDCFRRGWQAQLSVGASIFAHREQSYKGSLASIKLGA